MNGFPKATHFPDRGLYAAIPNALSAFLTTYENCSRGSGRTTASLAHVNDGDTVIFATTGAAVHFGRLAERERKFIRCVVVAVDKFNPGLLVEPGKRIWFDHGWITEYWERVLSEGSRKFWEVYELYNPGFQEVAPTPKGY